jgi:hypothetical protein
MGRERVQMQRQSRRSHITVTTGGRSSQTTLKRRNGRLVATKGNNWITGSSASRLEHHQPPAKAPAGSLVSVANSLQDDTYSCPSSPSILQGFSDDFNISSDFDETEQILPRTSTTNDSTIAETDRTCTLPSKPARRPRVSHQN